MNRITGRYFNEAYWTNGTRSGYTIHNFFRGDHLHQAKALTLQALYQEAEKYLIAGCARGWVVEELVKLDIDAYGFDISKWAVKHSPDVIKDRLNASNGLNPNLYKEGVFDVVATFETAEHIQADDVVDWFLNLFYWLKPGGKLFATICLGHNNIRGVDDNDKSHQTLYSRIWWEDLLSRVGFVMDQETSDKTNNIIVKTKEREMNLLEEMGWHLFAWEKPL
jgi:cyclopropane fatty-acyl-phospholipid synthase-like methyltransferase